MFSKKAVGRVSTFRLHQMDYQMRTILQATPRKSRENSQILFQPRGSRKVAEKVSNALQQLVSRSKVRHPRQSRTTFWPRILFGLTSRSCRVF